MDPSPVEPHGHDIRSGVPEVRHEYDALFVVLEWLLGAQSGKDHESAREPV